MHTSTEELAAALGKEAGNELAGALGKIKHCVEQLDDQGVWWRPSDSMNSVGNLMLHLSGNLRQWIISGVGQSADTRDRPAEFAERGPIAKAELLRRLEETVSEARSVLAAVSASRLLRVGTIQGFEVTGMQAIFESVAHFRGHAQEIVHLTRCRLGDAYEFDFVPATPEQGAADFKQATGGSHD